MSAISSTPRTTAGIWPTLILVLAIVSVPAAFLGSVGGVLALIVGVLAAVFLRRTTGTARRLLWVALALAIATFAVDVAVTVSTYGDTTTYTP